MNDLYDIPIVLFVFKRLWTVQMIIERIRLVKPCTFYIFADGPRESVDGECIETKKVRDYVKRSIDWECDSRLFFFEENKGCDRNIIEGLDIVFAEQRMAVIFEDDAVPTLFFFDYCKELLERYQNDRRIEYIAGFNAIGNSNMIQDDYTFGKTVPMSGAFAMWADRWNECDFELENWPANRDSGRFDSFFYSREARNKAYSEFNDVYDKKVTAWDLMVLHDTFDNDRVAIVPRYNLATSYGYAEGAFHPQKKREAKRLLPLMTAIDFYADFSREESPKVDDNKEYDYLRQKLMLGVKGNYFERKIFSMFLAVKNIAYKYIPWDVWCAIKKIVT